MVLYIPTLYLLYPPNVSIVFFYHLKTIQSQYLIVQMYFSTISACQEYFWKWNSQILVFGLNHKREIGEVMKTLQSMLSKYDHIVEVGMTSSTFLSDVLCRL